VAAERMVEATKATRRRKRPRWRKPLLRLTAVAAPALLSGTLRVLSWTLRTTMVNAEELFGRWARGERVIVAFWHNRILMMPIAGRGQRICIMNSQHRDGEVATRAAARWGIDSVRGSATRGGAGGFLKLVRAYRRGYSLAVVPDGPRGPRCKAKLGVIHLAKATGATIFPVSYAASRAKQLRSWDRLVIPLPFARVVVAIGDPLSVPQDSDTEQIEERRLALEQRLNDLERTAEAHLAA